ncbi:MAG: ABC transporter permease, partial [Bacillota bacterium]
AALAFRLFLPGMEQMEINFAVDPSVPQSTITAFQEYGKVEMLADRQALEDRVLEFDDVPGITYEGGSAVVVLEGNEIGAVKGLPGTILDYLQRGGSQVAFTARSMGRSSSQVKEYTAIFLVLTCIMIGGLTLGFNVVAERESRALRALSVSPLTTVEYVLAKSIVALTVALLLSLAVTGIMFGGRVDYGQLMLASLASLALVIVFGFIIGLLSDNQLTAIATMKVAVLIWTGVIVAAMVIPARLVWVLYPFPHYWAFAALQSVFVPGTASLTTTGLISAGFGLALIAVMVPRIRASFHLG